MSLLLRVVMMMVTGLSTVSQALPLCSASSASQQVQMVELYTSEGCNSCPPADRWLSSVASQPNLVAVAFHVDYWDRLGWVDRFASPVYTARQARAAAGAGVGFSYTPQVLVNGRDWRGWPRLPDAGTRAKVDIRLVRASDGAVVVSVSPLQGAPEGLALWWAQTEDGHASQVMAGENNGALLHHDRVVRQYGQATAWHAQAGQVHEERIPWTAQRNNGHATHFVLVVVDERSGAPVQAMQLDC